MPDVATQVMEFVTAASLKPRMEFIQLAFLWQVAAAGEEGISMGDIAKKLGTDSSFVTRSTTAFGPATLEEPLVIQKIDYQRRKYRLLVITEHGRRVLGTSVMIWNGQARYDSKNNVVRKID
ncbi:MAG: hypothetical protein HRU12_09875 [Phaeodactylibacter sp.]|nr:hypothetical protein [Phaeodactylibacter sp.]